MILGVFGNEGYDATVTVAQVFWLRAADAGGQPDRFYVTADKLLSVAGDFADFGSDMTALRRRLRSAGAQVYEVRRILKAFVDGQWLADFDTRLAEYAELRAEGAHE